MSHVEPSDRWKPDGPPPDKPFPHATDCEKMAVTAVKTMKTPTNTEIENDIKALRTALTKPGKQPGGLLYNADTRKMMEAQIRVLSERMTPAKVEQEYYVDETGEDYRDGDNDLWAELDRTARWLTDKENYEAPSVGL
jgi:hypothetical protein